VDEPRIRAATAADVPVIAEIVDQAYRHYITRMGKPAGPMLDDYAARVSEGAVWVLEEGAETAAIIVLVPAPNYLLLDNIAVSPSRQGLGLGRRLLAFAEQEALRRGYREIRLYTHQTMVENQRFYTSIGYEETGRGSCRTKVAPDFSTLVPKGTVIATGAGSWDEPIGVALPA
jgi:ribosomal protein S18 acetylase RimI-like enzyme